MVWLVRWFKWLKIPSTFTVSSNTQNIQIDHPYQILWTLLPEDSTNTDIFWNSSDESIATVDEWWLITPVSVWECTITWHTASNWLVQTIAVTTYVVHTTGVELNMNTMTLEPWTSQQLIATVLPELTNYPEITWSSSDDSIATVNSDWLVTCTTVWNCTITCTTVDWWYTDTCAVTCIIPVTWVTLNQSSWEVTTTKTLQLTATITPSNATIKTVTWSSSNTSVATVNNAWLVTYVGDWTCTITCTTNQWWLTATCSISATSFVPVDIRFWYTWAAQSILLKPHTYCLEVWWASWWVWSWWWENMRWLWWYSGWCLKITSNTTLYIYVWECWAQDQVWKFNWWAPWQERWGWQCASWWWWTDISLCWWTWDSTNHWYSRIIVAWWWWATWEVPSSQCWWHWWWCSWTVWWSNHVAWWPWTQTSAWWNYYNCSNYRVVCAASFGKWWTAYDTCHSSYDANWWWGGWYGWGWGWDDWWGWWWSWYVFTSATVWNYPSWRIPTSNYYLTNAYSCAWNTSFPSPSWWTETWHSWYWCARIRSL